MKVYNNEQHMLFDSMNAKMTLSDFQTYFDKVLSLRGFQSDSVEDKILLLVEEVGELAKAVRKEQSGLGIDYSRVENYDSVKGELADVLIVLIALSNLVGVNLYEAIYEKEKINIERRWGK
ncbi:MAG: hypothetical protein K2L07_01890 [Lachnospiraceae bacterium]|nr:hypothetical protein [Lachnospiraceae bacterium]